MLKVGMRVRIINSKKLLHKEATIYEVEPWNAAEIPLNSGEVKNGEMAYLLEVDGIGRYWNDGFRIAYCGCDLFPLTDPNAEWATEQVRKLFKMPVAA